MDKSSGIYYEDKEAEGSSRGYVQPRAWLPLLALSAHASICHSSSRVTVKQSFLGPAEKNVDEAAYCFPLYEGASVVAFTCKIGDRTIHGVVQEKNEARRTYEAAKDRGESAGLLIQNTPDVWSTKIGNIPAGSKVQVEIQYVCELKHDSEVDGIRFVLPTNIAPRYGDAPENLPASIDSASRGIEIVVDVTMSSPITSLQSSSHPIAVGIGTLMTGQTPNGKAFDARKAHANLSQASTALDKDFVLMIVAAKIGEPQAILETHPTIPNQRAVMLTLVPRFVIPRINPEIVFIADRSGSMEEKIPQLRKALTVFLKSLPVGVKFNICSFGDRFTFLWPKSRPYDQDNLDTALKHVETFEADYGGTEMFPPVEAALKQRYADLQTELLVLTDGETWDSKPLFDIVQRECKSGDVRVFSLGIGDSVSHWLVEGIAKAGRGYAQIVGDEGKLDAKVVRMLRAALGAHISEYKLHFDEDQTSDADGGFQMVEHEGSTKTESKDPPLQTKKTISLFDPTADCEKVESAESADRYAHLLPFTPPSMIQAPFTIPPLYPFNRSTVYVLLSSAERKPEFVTLRGSTTSGDILEIEVPVLDIGQGTTVHQLAARKLMRELEEGDSYLHSSKFGDDPLKDEGKFKDWVEREAVRVGITYGVAGKWTSFVAVENHEGKEQSIHQDVEDGIPLGIYTTTMCSLVVAYPCSSYPAPEEFDEEQDTSAPPLYFQSSRISSVQCEEDEGEAMCMILSESPPQALGKTSHSVRFRDGGSEGDAGPRSTMSCKPHADAGSVSDSTETGNEGEEEEEKEKETHDEEEEEENEDGKTYRLMKLQAFDGSFLSSSGDWLKQVLVTFTAFVEQQQDMTSVRTLTSEEMERVISTAFAVCTLERDMMSMEDVWSMVAEKADRWGTEKLGEKVWILVRKWALEYLSTSETSDDKAKQTFY